VKNGKTRKKGEKPGKKGKTGKKNEMAKKKKTKKKKTPSRIRVNTKEKLKAALRGSENGEPVMGPEKGYRMSSAE